MSRENALGAARFPRVCLGAGIVALVAHTHHAPERIAPVSFCPFHICAIS